MGRKGAGKTAFLIGCALAEQADVVLLKSEDIYSEVNFKLGTRYTAVNGALVADSLVFVWEVLLYHAAMWQIARSTRLDPSGAQERVWSYMSSFGNPTEIEADHLLASVSACMLDAVLGAPPSLSFREACWSIRTSRGAFVDAAAHAREVLDSAGRGSLYVVVDNLEDLHKHLDEFADVITALFRVATRGHIGAKGQLPFTSRFAFPAELLPKLSLLSANADKDFLDKLTIRWTATELIVVAGNRLRTFLDLYFPWAVPKLGLPKRHDPADRHAAEATLRAVLPERITNGYGSVEDPVAYLMRHTQLLPRHLIHILNEIVGLTVKPLGKNDVPQASAKDVINGVRAAEHTIVTGILTTYSYEHPRIGDAMAAIKNHAHVVESVSELHRVFNEASVQRKGLDFDEFVDASLHRRPGRRQGGRRDVALCRWRVLVHLRDGRPRGGGPRPSLRPSALHVPVVRDRRAIDRMAKSDVRPVYPYGSDPEHDDLEV